MDETLFSRLLVNLIQNAYRYGKEKGRILVSLFQDASSVYVRVSDDGIGIAPEELPKIWNRFYRSDPSRSAGTADWASAFPWSNRSPASAAATPGQKVSPAQAASLPSGFPGIRFPDPRFRFLVLILMNFSYSSNDVLINTVYTTDNKSKRRKEESI